MTAANRKAWRAAPQAVPEPKEDASRIAQNHKPMAQNPIELRVGRVHHPNQQVGIGTHPCWLGGPPLRLTEPISRTS